MGLKLRIGTLAGKTFSNFSTTEELLGVLADAQAGKVVLTLDEEDTLRGWLLLRAEGIQPGQAITARGNDKVAVGKRENGEAYVRDNKGEWPPKKPDMGKGF